MSEVTIQQQQDDATEQDAATTDATETTEQATPAKSLKERLAEIADGSRVTDTDTVLRFAERIVEGGKQALTILANLTDAYKRIAREQAFVRPFILTPEGHPDWAGNTGTYKLVAEESLSEVFGDLSKGDRNKVSAAIRAHVNRTYRELAILAYVAGMEDAEGNPRYPGILDDEGNVNPNAEGYDAFKYAVREQYRNAGLAVPSAYQTPQDRESGGGGGGGNNGGKDALTVLAAGVSVVTEGRVRDDYAAAALLQGVSAFVLNIANPQRDGGINNREVVGGFLHRIADVALAGAKACDNVLTASDREDMAESLWNESEDKAKLAKDAQ